MATLVYLYGPPAVGKLTVATALQARTSFSLFHNHLTVNAITPVFAFGSAAFMEVIHRLRLDVFETAARTGTDLIFTNSSAWMMDDGRKHFGAFADEARRRVESGGGRAVFVQLTAPVDVLESRVDADSRREHHKLLDATRLREILATAYDPAPLHADDLVIDTSRVDPTSAAALIAECL